ncbi:NfeD family protein [Candidatus Binatus sp.]|uniref:NfeD family protein n=1 Tax=Candidatus Binatus sp. TaxID=2811406 RepID=UPI003BAEA615
MSARAKFVLVVAALAIAIGSFASRRILAADAPPKTAPHTPPWVELITIDGSINPAVASYIDDSLTSANADGASALVIELDTPGGLLNSAEKIVKSILASPVPVIVYVAPSGASAASAGVFITEAAHVAAMAPGTTIGAAHPVEQGGEDIKGVMGTKIENFTATFARTIAQQRGRNEDWVEQAVRHSIAIGEREALAKNVVDIVAPDIRSLLTQASGRKVQVEGKTVTLALADAAVRRVRMTPGQNLLNVLADPNIVYLLMMAGLIGLYFEFAHPGVIFPGVAGAICLLLALASFQVLPVNLTGLLLIFLGVGMLISEAFVTSYGILGLGGVTAFVIGSLFFIDTSKTDLAVNRNIIYGAAAALTLIILGIGYIVARERRNRATTGAEGIIGEVGEVREAIAPGTPGKVFVHGEIWRAVSTDALGPGARARVQSINGLELQVQKA